MADLSWIPRFTVGDVTYAFSYPVTRWIPGERTVGRRLKSADGVPSGSIHLRRYTLGLTLRFTEDEWSIVREFIRAAQITEFFVWELNGPVGTSETAIVTLESPRVADPVRPTRDGSILWMMALPIVLGSDSVFDLLYFPNQS